MFKNFLYSAFISVLSLSIASNAYSEDSEFDASINSIIPLESSPDVKKNLSSGIPKKNPQAPSPKEPKLDEFDILLENRPTLDDYKNILSSLNSEASRSFLCQSLLEIINSPQSNNLNLYSSSQKIKVSIDCATYIDRMNDNVISSLAYNLFNLNNMDIQHLFVD